MDLVAACRAFVAVTRHGSFTVGAAAIGIQQSVVSRRVSALEAHLDGELLDRTSRVVTPTPFGADLLPAARRLVRLADELEHDAERARRRPFRLAMPAICPPRELALLVAAARSHGLYLTVESGAPADLSDGATRRVAIVAVPPDVATWRVPLGLAGDPLASHVAHLRPTKSDASGHGRRIWIQPEDDVPHLRDRVTRLGASVGLRAAQVVVADSLVEAAAEALSGADLLLCSAAQAAALGLPWGPIGELELARGYDAVAGPRSDVQRIRTLLHTPLAHCLGAPVGGEGE